MIRVGKRREPVLKEVRVVPELFWNEQSLLYIHKNRVLLIILLLGIEYEKLIYVKS
jgi:hypothetical protein